MAAPKILVVDDEIIIARELESRLGNLGYDVVGVASSGREAVELVDETLPDLILMDIVLKGDIDGIETASAIRERHNIPLIYLTAYTDEATLARARLTEPFGYIVKPFSERELRANIEMALYKHQVEDQLRQVERWFSASMEGATDGVIAVDKNGVITFLNGEAEALIGIRASDARGTRADELVRLNPETSPSLTRELVQRAMVEGIVTHVRDDTTLLTGSGESINVDITAACIREKGSRDGVVLVLRDRSERHRMRESLRESEAELRRKNEALEEADRRKDEFLAMLGHELRNPLAPLRNGLQVLRLAQKSGRPMEQALGIMERQLAHMTRLVDDLLDMSRISSGKIELRIEPLPLGEAIANAIEAVRSTAEERHQTLSVSLPSQPIILSADATRLEQIFVNVIANAIKYTNPGGTISVTAEQEAGTVVIRVRDTGSGMSPELVSKVFDLFRQGERTLDRSEGGLGIGLTMVKRLVELHGGQVEAFSEGIGKGSEFAIRLPSLTQEQWDEESTGAKDLDPDKRLRVLIVEDSRDVAEMLAVLVSLWGHEVETVYDGSSALEVFGRYQPNAVLCDLGLPGMDGYDVARHLRSSSGALQPLLVAVTGYGGEDEKTRSREAGFDVHMTKPVDPEALETLLAHHNRA